MTSVLLRVRAISSFRSSTTSIVLLLFLLILEILSYSWIRSSSVVSVVILKFFFGGATCLGRNYILIAVPIFAMFEDVDVVKKFIILKTSSFLTSPFSPNYVRINCTSNASISFSVIAPAAYNGVIKKINIDL